MHNIILLDTDLRLFDGAAAGGEGGAGASGEATTAPAAAGQGSGEPTVLYGKQPEAETPDAGEKLTGVQSTSNTLEEKQRAYREMIEGEYKDLYTQDIQRIINARFRQTKALEKQVAEAKPLIDMMMQRYDIQDGGVDKLRQAVEEDNRFWSDVAEAAGLSVEQYKAFQKLKWDNAEFLEQERNRRNREAADEQFARWAQQEQELKALYPNFDLKTELENEQFRFLISNAKSPVPLRHAYEVIHMDEIKESVARMQAQATQKQVVDSIRAKGARPAENGTTSQSAFQVRDDVSKLSKKDLAEINRRIMRGERITFG